MDTSTSQPSCKRQRLFIGIDAAEGHKKDIISHLPSDVLSCILSFLPTKDVIKTSILSRKWKYLWTTISDLDFENKLGDELKNNQTMEVKTSFVNLVDKALLLREAYHIRKLRLAPRIPITDTNVNWWISRVNWWIDAAVKHKLEKLNLSFSTGAACVLPHCLFTSKSLRKLKLDMCCVLRLPGSICFSSLKTLHLSYIIFKDELSTQQLFSGCPVLEKLSLYSCGWKNMNRISISIPTLRTLSIFYDPLYPEFLLDCVVEVTAINLRSLDCSSYLSFELSLCDLFSLENAYVDVMSFSSSMQSPAVGRAIKLLGGLHSVKYLTLSVSTLECLCYVANLQHHFPTFYNLSHLDVCAGCSDYCSGTLMDLLQKSPKVESLDIFQGFDPDICFVGEGGILNTVPHCVKYFLKTFCISNFSGESSEIELLKYLLVNTTVLERIRIFCAESLSADTKKKGEICDHLQKLSRCSASCAIELI